MALLGICPAVDALDESRVVWEAWKPCYGGDITVCRVFVLHLCVVACARVWVRVCVLVHAILHHCLLALIILGYYVAACMRMHWGASRGQHFSNAALPWPLEFACTLSHCCGIMIALMQKR